MIGLVTGCIHGVKGGIPTLATSDSNGTSVPLPAREDDVVAAITNAFQLFRYQGMWLYPRDHAARIGDWLPFVGQVTNGFTLTSEPGHFTSIPLDNGKVVPYLSSFYISIKPISSMQTVVNVKTIQSSVQDGREYSIHAGWGAHFRDVPPIREEEEKVIKAIAHELLP